MSAQIEDFKTNFTFFLNHETTRHLVKVVTDDKIIECSGVILSQHSEKLREMIQEDEEVFLQGYESVDTLLWILHGGFVILTIDNCLEIIKFAWEFGIPNIAEQALDFMESIASEETLVPLTKICLTANNLIKFFAIKNNEDVFWPIENVIKNLSSSEVEEFVKSFDCTEIAQMFVNKTILREIMPIVSNLINDQNVNDIVKILKDIDFSDLVAAASGCFHDDAVSFFEAIAEYSNFIDSQQFLLSIKSMIFREIGTSLAFLTSSKPDINLVCQHWKKYDANQMLLICQQRIPSFYLMELVLSWVSYMKPSKCIVKRLSRFIDASELYIDYAEHAISIFKNLGYNPKFNLANALTFSTEQTCNHQVSKINEIRTNFSLKGTGTVSVSEKVIKFSCMFKDARGGCEENGSIIFMKRAASAGVNSVNTANGAAISCTYRTGSYIYPENKYLDSKYVIYAKTVDGKHVPIYTDLELAVNLDYYLKSIGLTKIVPKTPQSANSDGFQPKRLRKS